MNTEFITESQKKINRLMSIYEETSQKLLDCSVDDIPLLMQKRQNIMEETAQLDHRIKLECSDEPEALSAYLNKCSREGLSDELAEIFELRQEFNAIGFRVKNLDPEIMQRFVAFRDEAMEEIKKNNSGHSAKAAKYGQLKMPDTKKVFIPENKKQI